MKTVRRCSKCLADKPLDLFFYEHTRGRYVAQCKDCHRSRCRKWRWKNPDAVAAMRERANPKRRGRSIRQSREWREANPDRARLQRLRYMAAHPERVAANQKFQRAVREGRIIRPNECERCGEKSKPQGHHEDYSKPFEVLWLCSSCHRRAHDPRVLRPKAAKRKDSKHPKGKKCNDQLCCW